MTTITRKMHGVIVAVHALQGDKFRDHAVWALLMVVLNVTHQLQAKLVVGVFFFWFRAEGHLQIPCIKYAAKYRLAGS